MRHLYLDEISDKISGVMITESKQGWQCTISCDVGYRTSVGYGTKIKDAVTDAITKFMNMRRDDRSPE